LEEDLQPLYDPSGYKRDPPTAAIARFRAPNPNSASPPTPGFYNTS
jgi:hypothetical protein